MKFSTLQWINSAATVAAIAAMLLKHTGIALACMAFANWCAVRHGSHLESLLTESRKIRR